MLGIGKKKQRSWFERRRRAAARIALYSSLILVAGSAVLLVDLLRRSRVLADNQDWVNVDFAAMEEVQLLQGYVSIDTSLPDGDEVAGAEFLARQLAAAGIPTTLEVVEGKHANLWAVLEGRDPQALVLHNHIDVDPVKNPAAWIHPPFSGHIRSPWIYGRGVFDMKSITIAQLMAVLELRRSGKPLSRSVVFLATSSEEVGSDLGMRWILRQHPELVDRFGVLLTEGGAVEARGRFDIKYWGTEFAQKHFVKVVVCDADRNRLETLAREVWAMGDADYDRRLVPEAARFLEAYAGSRDSQLLRRLLAEPESLVTDLAKFGRLSPFLKAMLSNQVHASSVREAPGGGYEMDLLFHLLPGVELAEARQRLLPRWQTWGMTMVSHSDGSARHGSPLDHPVFQTILRVLDERHPGLTAGPYFLPWTATDARFVRARGIPAYGFSPFLILTTDTLQIAGPNERMALPAFAEGVELYVELVDRLTD